MPKRYNIAQISLEGRIPLSLGKDGFDSFFSAAANATTTTTTCTLGFASLANLALFLRRDGCGEILKRRNGSHGITRAKTASMYTAKKNCHFFDLVFGKKSLRPLKNTRTVASRSTTINGENLDLEKRPPLIISRLNKQGEYAIAKVQ